MSGGGVGSAWTVPSVRDVATPLKDDSRDDVAPGRRNGAPGCEAAASRTILASASG